MEAPGSLDSARVVSVPRDGPQAIKEQSKVVGGQWVCRRQPINASLTLRAPHPPEHDHILPRDESGRTFAQCLY